MALLQTAYDAGVRHFDVARVYGSGRAEGILGRFLQARRSECTITTKFGLSPPRFGPLRSLIPLMKQAVKVVPGLDRQVKGQVARMTRQQTFSVPDARRSLEESLRELRTDYVDVVLMHEATAADASSAELLEFLEDQRQSGKILRYGIGGAFGKIRSATAFPPAFSVFQFDSNVLTRHAAEFPRRLDQVVVVFGALSALADCRAQWGSHMTLARSFERETGLDPSDMVTLASLLLAWSVHHGRADMVLFGSTQPDNILRNARAVADARFSAEITRRFGEYTMAMAAGVEARP